MNELEIIRYAQIDGLSVFFDTVDYRTPHFHPEWELIWILENALSVTCGKERYLVQPGQMILFNPSEPHEFHKTGESCTFLCLQISASILPGMHPVHVDGKLPHLYLTQEQMQHSRQLLSEITHAYLGREEHYALYCTGKSCLLLHGILSSLPTHILTREETDSIDKRNARLKRLIRFVDDNYMHKIRLADFAQAEGCSLSYLSRFIKNTMNQNFQEYVTSVRFNCACKLIAAGGKRMLDICMESGFSDYRYFSREFQRQYGMTPEEYSIYSRQRQLRSAVIRHSLHSVERFYSGEESLKLAQKHLSFS
jgi:AraC-like DNA-binding protein